MGEFVVKILVGGFAVWVIWSILQQRYVFVISVNGGQPFIRSGKVTKAFLGRVAAVCQEGGVVRGWVGGVLIQGRVALRFSRHFPPGLRQRLRNEWHTVG
jgi:hypothetical protein